jgi:hypothetical protein
MSDEGLRFWSGDPKIDSVSTDFLGLPSRSSGHSPPSPRGLRRGSLHSAHAKAGGTGRTRTCNQTVMSGRIEVGSVDLLRFRWRSSVFVVLWRGRFRRGFTRRI